eukprot:1194608-Prorocentrum_minimum.AAC.5
MGCLCPGRDVCSGGNAQAVACFNDIDTADTQWSATTPLPAGVVVGCATVDGISGNGGLELEVSTNGGRTWDPVGANATNGVNTVKINGTRHPRLTLHA